jgi:hypothetical protein
VDGAVYKFTPIGLRSIFASGLTYPNGLAIDSADNLFVADVHWEQQTLAGSILKITPSGVRTTFASRIVAAMAFQRNLAPNLRRMILTATAIQIISFTTRARTRRLCGIWITTFASAPRPGPLYRLVGERRV